MKAQRARLVLAAVSLCAASLLMTACSAPGSTSKPEPVADAEYPAAVAENFIAACAAQPGATEALCEGCFEIVKKEIPYDEFVAMEKAMNAGTATEEQNARLEEVLATCAS